MSFLAAGITLPFLGEVVALLIACVLLAYICYRINLTPIVGFLLAGVIIGPTALGLVKDQELINGMAEVGVILLLFTIGVEFSLEKLSRLRRVIFGSGGVQVGLSVAVVTGLLLLFDVSIQAALFTGGLVALSSTAIVLKLMADRNEIDSPTGRLSLAILIFQDFAIIVMVLFVSALGGEGSSPLDVLLALGEAVLLIGLVLVGARKAVPWFLERVAKTRRQELFLPSVVAICFGTAWLTSLAGVSLALGAFLAGLVVSESRYSEHALSEILPLRTLFNAVFFVSVGMLLDLRFLAQNPLLVLGVASAVLIIKVAVGAISVLVMRYPIRIAAAVGLTLAQIGEFSFVLERTGQSVGLSPADMGESGTQAFIAVTVLLMAITPVLVRIAPKLGDVLQRTPMGRFAEGNGEEEDASVELEDHVIIVGYGPAGQRLARVLHDSHLPFSIIDLNPTLVAEADAEGFNVIQGDASRPHILEHAGIERAKLVVVVINDDVATNRTVEMTHYLNPTVQIVARTRFMRDIERLQRAGADVVVPEELETSIRIFTHVLGAYMVPRDEIERQASAIRSGDYKVFRGSIHEAHLMVLQGLDEEGLHTRAVAVRDGAPIDGQTLRDLGLREKHNLTVLTIRRDGRTIGNPSGDFRIHAGDRLVMIGSAEKFQEAAHLFREEPINS